MTATQFHNQALLPETRLASKIITATRDLTAAGAPTDVAYTGVGFTPTSIVCYYVIDGSTVRGVGFSDSSKNGYDLRINSASAAYSYNALILLETTGGNNQIGTVKSFDSDGFTLTWTKGGSPTGSATLVFLCFR